MKLKPFYLAYNDMGILGIVGRSGSGKTSTVRFLLSQLALDGFGMLIADPHGNSGRENLTVTTEPLHNALLYPVAIEKNDRIALLRTIGAELRARLDGKRGKRLIFVMDETTRHFIDCTRAETLEQANILTLLANEGRKVGIHGILIAQNWKADFIGAASVRSSITHVLFHNTSENEVRLLAPSLPADMRRTIAQLKKGQAFFYPECIAVGIPYVSQDDLYAVKIPRDDSAFLRSLITPAVSLQEGRRAPIPANLSKISDAGKAGAQNGSRLQEIVRKIVSSIANGERKDTTIGRVFKIAKSDKRYRAASKLYDAVRDKYYGRVNE